IAIPPDGAASDAAKVEYPRVRNPLPRYSWFQSRDLGTQKSPLGKGAIGMPRARRLGIGRQMQIGRKGWRKTASYKSLGLSMEALVYSNVFTPEVCVLSVGVRQRAAGRSTEKGRGMSRK